MQAEAQPNFHDFHHELSLHLWIWKWDQRNFLRDVFGFVVIRCGSKEKFNFNYGAMGWLDDLHGTSWDWKKDFWGRRALHDGPKAAKAA